VRLTIVHRPEQIAKMPVSQAIAAFSAGCYAAFGSFWTAGGYEPAILLLEFIE
jgi:hypothetical protein